MQPRRGIGVPLLCLPLSELTEMKLTPEEGFPRFQNQREMGH